MSSSAAHNDICDSSSPKNKTDTASKASKDSVKNARRAERAEAQAKRIEREADQAESRAKHADREADAFIHRAKVEAERATEYAQKADAVSELWAKYQAAAASAMDLRGEAMQQKKQAQADAKRHHTKAEIEKAKEKQARRDSTNSTGEEQSKKAEARHALEERREAASKAFGIENKTPEAEPAAKKAEMAAKKAKLEAEEAEAAIHQREKHAQAAAQAQSQAGAESAEAASRRTEADLRRAQAAAKKAQAKALRIGDMEAAEAYSREAALRRAEAQAIHDAIMEKRTSAKAKRSPINQLPKNLRPFVEKKHLSAPGLINILHEVAQDISDPNQNGQKQASAISDCLMSGFALFHLKYPSLLQFEGDAREGGCIRHNLESLYKVNTAPSDTSMRERLDLIDPVELRPAFTKLFAEMQRGKGLEEYVFLDGHYLIAGDGCEFFSSRSIHCESCCRKEHRDGSHSYYHQVMSAAIVHPELATVIPLCPEPIIHSDGSKKNDCERNASERLYRNIRREHPHLPLIATEDALGSNGPHIRLFNELNMRYILVVKPDGNKSLFEFLKGVERQIWTNEDAERKYRIEFVNEVPLNDTHSDLKVNFLEAWAYDKTGALEYHNTWVTDIPITIQNASQLCRGGRAKWKIENETFNTLKNQGYHFEHNFGHGKKHLSTVFVLLMFLAFLVDQIQQSCCGLFQAGLVKMKSKVRLWGRIRALFTTMFIESWDTLWRGIVFGIKAGHLTPLEPSLNTS